MKKNFIYLLVIAFISVTSCKSMKNKSENSFVNQFFNNPSVIYNLKKYTAGNQINILDSKKLISQKPLIFKNDDITINVIVDKNDFVNYNLQQYTINKDLAFVVLWEYGKNRALCFFLNKGKSSGKWYLVEALERTTR